MNKIILPIIFIAYILSFTTISAQEISYNWAKNFGGMGTAYGKNITLDDQGNIIMIGYQWGEVVFDDFDLTGSGHFLVKMDNEGNTLWAKGIFNASTFFSIAVDNDYNIYVSGNFIDSLEFNGETIMSHGSVDTFIMKYDQDGNPIWIRTGGGEGADMTSRIALDSENNILHLAGCGSNLFTVHDVEILNDLNGDIGVVSKFDSEGNLLWANKIGNIWADVWNIAVDFNDNVIIASDIYDLEFGSSYVSIAPGAWGAACFLVYNKHGEDLWGKCSGGGEESYNTASIIETDDGGNLYLIGTYSSEITFDDIVLPDPIDESTYLFVAKFNSDGDIEWVKKIVGQMVYPEKVVIKDSEIYLLGSVISQSIHFDSVVISVDQENGNNFLTKLNEDGEFLWAAIMPPAIYARSIALDLENKILMTGGFIEDIDLNGLILSNTGDENIFLINMNQISTGIKIIEKHSKFNLYPNPFSNHAVLHAEKELYHATLTVTNIVGQIVQKMDNLQGNEVIIDRKNLSPGIYFVNVFEKDQILTSKKIVVQ